MDISPHMLSKQTIVGLIRQSLWDEAARYTKSNGMDLISLGSFLGLRSALFFCGELSIHDVELH